MEGASILIVEDEAISALYLKNLLSRLNYRVLDIVATGENAITKAGDLKPDLILMDIRLAGEMDGIQAADIVHSTYDIPIVFLTAHLDEDSMRRAMATDPAGYVPKPTSERELRGTIEMALKNDILKKQLRASEARFRSIFNTASVSIVEIDFSRVKTGLDELRQGGISELSDYLEINSSYIHELLSLVNVLDFNDWNLQLFNAPDRKKLTASLYNFGETEGIAIFRALILAIWRAEPYYEGEGIIRTCNDNRKFVKINVAFLTGGIDLSRVLVIASDITQAKLAEAALRESEEKYRRVVNTAQEGVWILNEDGKTTYLNNRIGDMFGYSLEEMTGQSVNDFIFPEQRAYLQERVKMRSAGIAERYEMRFRRKNGNELWAIISATPIISDQGKYMGAFAMLTDITERKKAEEQLLFQAMVLDQIHDRVTVTDLDGRITYVNEAEIHHLKYSRQELIGQKVDFFGEDATRGATQQTIIERTRSDGEWRGEVVNFDAEGKDSILDCRTRIVHDENGNPIAMCGISTDITERKKIEKALAESEARYRQIVETTQEGVWILDKDLKLTFINPRIVEMFGYSYEELMEKSIEVLIFPEDLADHRSRIAECSRGKGDQYERRFRRKDGSPVWMNITATPIFNNIGEFHGVVSLFTDISARKDFERGLERQQVRRQMLDSLSQKLSKLNLDFKTTLQTAAKQIIEMSGDICIIRLVSEDGLYLQPIAIHHPDPKKRVKIEKLLIDSHIGVNEGIYAHVVKTGQSILISRESNRELIELMTQKYRTLIQKLNMISGMDIPIYAQGTIIGDISLGRSEGQEKYTEEDRLFFQEVADRIGLSIANARMYSRAQKEIEDRRKIETAVRLSEEKYRDLFELSPDSIILLSPEGIILDCNLSTSTITGLSKEAMIGKLFSQIITLPPELHAEYSAFFSRVLAGKQFLPFEMGITRLDGQKLDLELYPKLFKKEGLLTGVQVISRNITERKLNEQNIKDSLAEKEILLSELNHRVKNNLTSIVAILDLQKSYLNETQMVDLITELQERIRLMALIHEQLYRSKNLNRIDFSRYLEDLTTNLVRALLKERNIQLDIHTDAAQLSVAIAIPCGQIVTELVTNALKYAFPEEQSDRWKNTPRKIDVSFIVADDRYILKVCDNGVGLPAGLNFSHAETLGMQLVMLLTNQLDGTIETTEHPGTAVTITFPIKSSF